jgi:cell division protein DivIC
MKKILVKKKNFKWVKNKFLVTTIVFFLYALFLDDWDVFQLIKQNIKLTELNEQRSKTKKELDKTLNTLNKLKTPNGIEAFAREEKFFKKDNEDIFVISYE